MSDLEKAARMALEALEHLQPTALTSFYTIGDRDKAITALRQALEQAEQAQPVAEGYAAQLIEALYENGDPVSVEAAEYLENHATPLEVMRHYERIEQRIKGET